jgi:hypothetical protein
VIIGNKQWVVIDYNKNSEVVAVFGPFPDEETANGWSGMPTGPTAEYRTHALYSAPEWYEGIPDEDASDG